MEIMEPHSNRPLEKRKPCRLLTYSAINTSIVAGTGLADMTLRAQVKFSYDPFPKYYQNNKPPEQCPGGFFVAGTGLEPVTFGL